MRFEALKISSVTSFDFNLIFKDFIFPTNAPIESFKKDSSFKVWSLKTFHWILKITIENYEIIIFFIAISTILNFITKVFI